ncbi:MAG: type II toxin-antitoxin system prevent-host-death family antitoxin [Acidaminobacter sp.]|uniref:type II toxin-antitoxin system Phd/YefM family antitoxin n=1 Tax=Acidaminobacter sp. TaxID=1872102 RepID=UPI00137FCA85|nr:type II toxin-antitoxin system Phd/YefM family antitoxin [Acidaminobacter sp.]MZQ99448.1 type II toxin-antitoxin system prevent-host-death family antitoxin [Acidaminobacter sp.]
MLAVSYSTLRNHLKDYCDKVCDDNETVIVTRKDEKNVVIISLEDYNNMMENLFVMSNQKNYERLLESRRQIESGETIEKL